MRHGHIFTLMLVIGALTHAHSASAGPWTPEPGHGYAKLWISWLPGVGYHAGDGQTYDYGPYHELRIAGYAEMGLVDRVALTLHAPLLNTYVLTNPRSDDTEVHASLGDWALGVRWNFLKTGRLLTALDMGVRFPMASSRPIQDVYASSEGMPQIGQLRAGPGVLDTWAALSMGLGFDGYYFTSLIGYTHRTDSFDDVLDWSIEFGVRYEWWSGRIRILGHHPVDTGDALRTDSPNGANNGTRYIAFALENEIQVVEDWYIGLGFEGGIGAVSRQTGGIVLSSYVATKY